jgi:hypothetical protein
MQVLYASRLLLLLLLLLSPHLQVQVWVVSLLLSYLANMLEQRQGLQASSQGARKAIGTCWQVHLPVLQVTSGKRQLPLADSLGCC